MKLSKTTSTEVIQLCQSYFCFELPSVTLKKEVKNLETSTVNTIYSCYDI